jgi:pimeloyl-ACP methyl ester carboxylesterase
MAFSNLFDKVNLHWSARYPLVLSQVDSSTTEISTSTCTNSTQPLVRRKYDTFIWLHATNEYNINYRVEGPVDGPPILLVHGFGANVNHFRYQFPALVKEGYRVYAIDLLGFGASDKPAHEEYCIELFAQLLKDFILTMHNGVKWIVAGNSIGGLCSLSVSEQIPNVIKGVVLFNSAGGMTVRYVDVHLLLRPVLYFIQKVVLGPQMGGCFFFQFQDKK